MKMIRPYVSSIIIVLFLFLVWEVGAILVAQPFILPSPTQIIWKVWELKGVLFFKHLPATLLIIIIGLLISIVLGVCLAVWMNSNKSVEKAFYPILVASQTIPIIALAPIFVLWFGYSIWSKVFVTVLITFFPITVNTFDGLRATEKPLTELMLTMGATKKDIFFKISIPIALPFFYSGLKVAVTLSVIGAAIGEWLGAQKGLGYFSRRMMTQFDGAGVFAPIVLLSLIGILLFIFVTLLEKISCKGRKTE